MKKFSNKNDKLKNTLYALAGIAGIFNAALWIIVEINNDFPYEHPIIFGIGLGSLFLLIISGFILSCVREYKYNPKEFMQSMKKIIAIILSSVGIAIILIAIILGSLKL
ncbi:hypothetical protein IKE67_04955 [bacterium]|nr:hypothetical protein [bacterium]